MRISDWSSDVCSSDLDRRRRWRSEGRRTDLCDEPAQHLQGFAAEPPYRVNGAWPLPRCPMGIEWRRVSGLTAFRTKHTAYSQEVSGHWSLRFRASWLNGPDRTSTRLNPVTNAHLLCRLLLSTKK